MSENSLIRGTIDLLRMAGVKLIEKDTRRFLEITNSRLFKGSKGLYLNFVLKPTPNGPYGDYMIVESLSKKEREANKKAEIIGNGVFLHSNKGNGRDSSSKIPAPQGKVEANEQGCHIIKNDEIPF
jgi:hypothetical protein